MFTYSIIFGNDKNLFMIREEIGLIRIVSLLDVEIDLFIELVIGVYNSKFIGFFYYGFVIVIIFILDINDNVLVFKINEINVIFDENIFVGIIIYKVVVIDVD